MSVPTVSVVQPKRGRAAGGDRPARHDAGVRRRADLRAHERLPETPVRRDGHARRGQPAAGRDRRARTRAAAAAGARRPGDGRGQRAPRADRRRIGTATCAKTDSVSQQDADNAAGSLEARQAAVESARHNVQRLEQLQAFTRITRRLTASSPRATPTSARSSIRAPAAARRASCSTSRRPTGCACSSTCRSPTRARPRPGLDRRPHAGRVPGPALHRHARADRRGDRPGVAHAADRDSRWPTRRASCCPAPTREVHLKLPTPASTLRAAGERADVPQRRVARRGRLGRKRRRGPCGWCR